MIGFSSWFVMHLLCIDDSGTICPAHKITQDYFVLAGPIIPEEEWHNLKDIFFKICETFNVQGEIKWRFFGQRPGREDKKNTLSHLNTCERDKLREELLEALIAIKSIKIITVTLHQPTIYKSVQITMPEQAHAYVYKSLVSLFQMYLQGLSVTAGSKNYGLIISDHRNPMQDTALRNLHMEILKSDTPVPYPNLIEGLFFSPSHHSIGIQFADLIAGAVFRHYQHGDSKYYNLLNRKVWEPSKKQTEELLLKLGLRKVKDAESVKSFNLTEPT